MLPLAQPAYTFAVPAGMEVSEGDAVSVQFGARKYYTGIVWRLHNTPPRAKRIKSIERKLYDRPLLTAAQRALWEWIARYYLSSLGEVMRCALPSLIKPSAESAEQLLEEEFHPRTERYYALKAPYDRDEQALGELLDRLERRAPKQYEILLEVASHPDRAARGEVARRLLAADRTLLNALVKRGALTEHEHTPSTEYGTPQFRLPTLSEAQQRALDALRKGFDQGKSTALLHGITGSGKTEIYIHLVAEVLARGGDVLLLVPEIALTAQLIERMERIFGARLTAYHSRLTDRRRSECYLRLNSSSGGEFVVGVRSSIFLPLKKLQLIIVDEEHDASYKQVDPAPRYAARDVAVYMAHALGIRTLLGSATPSLESWYNAADHRPLGFAPCGATQRASRPLQ